MTDQTFNEKDSKITLYHLAHMISGWSRAEQPGEAFSYNDEAINLYGKAVYNYIYQSNDPSAVLKTEFSALQFEHNPSLDAGRTGRLISVSIGDIGRLAHLFLNKGNWNGTVLLDSNHIYELMGQTVPLTMPITSGNGTPSFNAGTLGGSDYQNEGDNGPGSYSYNFWLNKGKKLWSDLDPYVYQGNGHWGGENYTIFPNQELIVIHYGKTATHSQMNDAYSTLVRGITSDPIPITEIKIKDTTNVDMTGKKEIGPGTQPMCVTDADDNLHIVYKHNGIKYLKMSPVGVISDKFDISSDGDNPQMVIDVKGNMHVVWDTFSKAHYRKHNGTQWETTIELPQVRNARNWFPHVAADLDGTAYWSVWGIDANVANSSYFGWIDGTTPKTLFNQGANRPPRLLGPTVRDSGDGKVYAIPGDGQPPIKTLTSSGPTAYKTMKLFSQKTGEGNCPFWLNGKPAIVFNEVLSGTAPFGVVFNYLPDNIAYKIVGPINEETNFPRAAYDAENDVVYAFWHEFETGFYASIDNATKTVSSKFSIGHADDAGRGRGAGGIAYTGKGGVYLVYSQGGTLVRQIVGDYSGVAVKRKTSLPGSSVSYEKLGNTPVYTIKGERVNNYRPYQQKKAVLFTREGKKVISH
ncbi:MAG: hypothetical protein HQK83_19165, partial [Fibrobacteria bacterium]|nr:hypothetical protein [Fibrobacteria bacterium]